MPICTYWSGDDDRDDDDEEEEEDDEDEGERLLRDFFPLGDFERDREWRLRGGDRLLCGVCISIRFVPDVQVRGESRHVLNQEPTSKNTGKEKIFDAIINIRVGKQMAFFKYELYCRYL